MLEVWPGLESTRASYVKISDFKGNWLYSGIDQLNHLEI